MSRLLLSLVAVAGLALPLRLAMPASAADILVNGSFEQVTAGGQLSPWKTLDAQLARVGMPAPVAAGAYAARLTQTGPGPIVQQMVPVVAGAGYELKGRLWLASSPRALLRLEFRAPNGQTLSSESSPLLTAPGAWEPLAVSASAPAGSGYALAFVVPLSGVPGQELFLDDFSLEEVLPPPSPVPSQTATAVPSSITPQPSGTASPEDTPVTSPSSTPEPDASPEPVVLGADDGSGGMLLNGGFERWSEGAPTDWRKYGGNLSSSADRARSGQRAALLSSDTDSTKWLWQPVSVASGNWYEFSACGWSEGGDWFLRISWYASPDAGGSALSSADAAAVVGPGAGFEPLTTGPVPAPDGAQSARARIMFRPASGAPATLYVDDAWMAPSAPPPPGVTPAAVVVEAPAEAEGDGPREGTSRPARVATAGPGGTGEVGTPAGGTPPPTATLFSQVLAAGDRAAEPEAGNPDAGGRSRAWVWTLPAAGLAAAAGGGAAYAWQRRRHR